MVLIQSQVVLVGAQIQIQPPVPVVICCGGMGKRALGRAREVERIALQRKRPIALIDEQQRPRPAHHQQILQPPIVEVDEERARSVVQHAYARLLCHVLKCAVSPIPVEPVRQSCCLAHVQIVEAVSVEIPRCHAVVAVNIQAHSAIEHGPPVIRAEQHLSFP
jgi:hypothetical protein